MNELIERIFENFVVGGVQIPVVFMFYQGHGEPYVTYQLQDTDTVLNADNEIQNYVVYYDFNVYSKENFFPILDAVKQKLKEAGFAWQPSKESIDFYEPETGYYHRTLNFAYVKGED